MKNTFIPLAFILLSFLGTTTKLQAQNQIYGDSISVIFFLLDECKICDYYGPSLNKFAKEHPKFEFIGYFPNFSSKKAQIEKFKENYNIQFPLKTDYYKTKSRKFDVEVLPTVVVYDQSNDKILYKGKIDDRFHSIGVQKRHIKENYLHNILTKIEKNQSIDLSFTHAVGCFINFTDNISRIKETKK